MSSTCSICSNPAARALIDGALIAGERPAHVHDQYGEALGMSRSAVYRHARGHVRMAPVYLGDRSRGEIVADLSQLAHSLYGSHVEATAAGQHAAAARFGAEARQAFSKLLEMDIENEDKAGMEQYADEAMKTFGQLLFQRRDLLPVAAEIARRRRYNSVLQEFEVDLPEAYAARDAHRAAQKESATA